jgi:hypothetical protein
MPIRDAQASLIAMFSFIPLKLQLFKYSKLKRKNPVTNCILSS